MTKIYKYPIKVQGSFTIEMPAFAKILNLIVDQKTGIPCIYAMVESEFKNSTRQFLIYGTGHEIRTVGIIYIGTFQTHNGEFIGHLFENLNAEKE